MKEKVVLENAGVQVDKNGKAIPLFKVQRCAFPPCGQDASINEYNVPLCRKHHEMLDFLTWALQSIRVSDAKPVDATEAKVENTVVK